VSENNATSNTNGLRWGIVGAARFAPVLVAAIRQAGGTVAAVASRNLDRAQAFANEHAIASAYGDYQALYADPNIDAVYIPTPNSEHKPQTLAALAAGKHVVCEKPLGLSASEVVEMYNAAKVARKLLFEGYAYRFHPLWAAVKAALAEIGEIRAVHGAFHFKLERDDDVRWRRELGGGALYDIGCYCLDAMRLLLGREPVAAYALAGETVGGVDENLSAVLAFPGFSLGEVALGAKLLASISCSFSLPLYQCLSFLGSKGVLEIGPEVFTYQKHAPQFRLNGETRVVAEANPYALMIEHVEAVVAGGTRLRFGEANAIAQARALDLVLAAWQRSSAEAAG
jgi:D-xylose 1-dehydrogenase (NADP+, D-xylono-1,5-lactone-forming)